MLFSFVPDWHKYVEQKSYIFNQITSYTPISPHKSNTVNKLENMIQPKANYPVWTALFTVEAFRNGNANICLSLQSWKPYGGFNGHQCVFLLPWKITIETLLDDCPCKDCATLLCGSLISCLWILLLGFMGMNTEGLDMSFSMGKILFGACIQFGPSKKINVKMF